MGLFATGGTPKKLDVLEAVAVLADLGLLPASAVVAINQGYQEFKQVIRDAILIE